MEESFGLDTMEDGNGFSIQALHSLGVLEDGEELCDFDDDRPIIYGEESNGESAEESAVDLDSESEYDADESSSTCNVEYLQKCLSFTPEPIHLVNISRTANLLCKIATNPFFPYDNKVTKQLADLVSKIST